LVPTPACADIAGAETAGAETFPAPEVFVLDNGVPVVSLALEQAPLVCLDFWCRAGSAAETRAESGLAHFLEHMVFKGSDRLGAGEFDRRIEALGGGSNAATGFDDVHYHVLIPPQAAPEALELLLDLVLHPRLEPADFQMERQVVLEELAQSEDQPEEVAIQRLLAEACPDHAYGRPILGERKALVHHRPEGMAAFHHRGYGSGSCGLAVAGALESLDLTALAGGSSLAALPPVSATDTAAEATIPPLRLRPGRHRITLPRLEAARVLMAWPLPPAADLEAVAGADLLSSLLAEGRCSRLVQCLREDLRLVESIDLDLNVLEAGSLALLEAVCEPGQVDAVVAAIEQVWQGLLDTPPGPVELDRARRLVANGYRFALESASSVAGHIGSQVLWGRLEPLQRPLERLGAWTVERLAEEMVPLLDPSRACRLVALPA
jgi:predicted Zn-dependent peptidase